MIRINAANKTFSEAVRRSTISLQVRRLVPNNSFKPEPLRGSA